MGDVTRRYQFVNNETHIRTGLAYTGNFNNAFGESSNFILRHWPDSFVNKKASCFSGTMRKIVQLLAGMNSRIAFEYEFTKTHGIYISSVTGQYWVIEISSSGITAWPLSICRRGDGGPGDLVGVPRPVPTLPAWEDRVLLAGLGEMVEPYEGFPLSPETGWAFSESGHSAVNVLFVGGLTPGAPLLEVYQKSALWTINFNEDADGTPNGATFLKTNEEWAYSTNIKCNVRVPSWLYCGPGLIRRGFFVPGDGVTRPVDDDITFPIYAYYEGETLKLYNYVNLNPVVTSGGTYRPCSNLTWSCVASPQTEWCATTGIKGRWYIPASYVGQTYYFGRSETKSGYWIEGVDCLETGYNIRSVSDGWTVTITIDSQGGPACGDTDAAAPPQSPVWLGGSWVKLLKDGRYSSGYSEGYQFSFVVPFFEREAVIFADYREVTTESEERHLQNNYALTNWLHFPKAPSVQWTRLNLSSGCTETDCPDEFVYAVVDGNDEYYTTSDYYLMGGSEINDIQMIGGAPETCSCDGSDWLYYTIGGTYDRVAECQEQILDDETEEDEYTVCTLYKDGVKTEGSGDPATLWSGDLINEPGDCIGASPIWMGVWIDVFTGQGFFSSNPDTENTGPEGLYERTLITETTQRFDTFFNGTYGLPIGFFGTPFPEDT